MVEYIDFNQKGKLEFIEDKNTSETLDLLNGVGIKYEYVDVMKDEMVGGIVLDINHQEFPQIYSHGHFLGSLQNLRELQQNSEIYSLVLSFII